MELIVLSLFSRYVFSIGNTVISESLSLLRRRKQAVKKKKERKKRNTMVCGKSNHVRDKNQDIIRQ